jgi:hypothetical protein
MYARNVALHLKPNTLSDFTKAFNTNVLPLGSGAHHTRV